MVKSQDESKSPAKKADKPKKATKAAKPKGEKAAKRPLNAYMRFAQDERPKVAKANPTWGVTEVAKELGKRYAALTDAEKEKYKALAKKEFDAKQ